MRLLLVLGLMAFAVTGAAAQLQSERYVNPRFGTVIDYPADWEIVEPGPTNDDGRTFTDGNPDAKFLAYGRYNTESKDLEMLQREAAEFVLAGIKPSYSRAKGRWFVVSAVVGNNIVYHKELLSRDGDIVHSFHAEYPIADKARYDAAVTMMANSLSSRAAE